MQNIEQANQWMAANVNHQCKPRFYPMEDNRAKVARHTHVGQGTLAQTGQRGN